MVRHVQEPLFTYYNRIIEAVATIDIYVDGITYEEFLGDTHKITRDAVVMQLQHIGETVYNIHKFYPGKNNLPKKQAIHMRNIISHAYRGIDIKIVRKTIQYSLPELKEQCRENIKK